MTVRKILLVDDSKTELYVVSDMLRRAGFDVQTAENGDQAWQQLDTDRPDLILMDVVMPGQNGFQLTRRITRDPRYADLPVIICSTKQQETDRVWALRQGARDYVVKPVVAGELIAKIRQFD